MVNSLVFFALCALFVLSEAIRLETLAQTLGVLQQEGAFDDTKNEYSFDSILAVRLTHGVWEPDASVAPADLMKHFTKKEGVQFTQEWSDAVTTYNIDAKPKHTAGNLVTRVKEAAVKAPEEIKSAPVTLTTEMGDLLKKEYRNHGYYLPVPISGFYAILESPAMTELKEACAEAAAKLPATVLTVHSQKGTAKDIAYEIKVSKDMVDCKANARITVAKPADSKDFAKSLSITFP